MQMVLHRGKVDFVRERADMALASSANEDMQVVPKWLWGAVGIVIMVLTTALGSAGTWVIVKTVEHHGTLIEHKVRLASHDEKLTDVAARLTAIDQKMDRILEQVSK